MFCSFFLIFSSESYVDNSTHDEQSLNAKHFIEEQETTIVEEDLIVKQEPLSSVNSETENSVPDHRITMMDDRIKQNDIIKEAGSVILSTCYETSVPVDTVVESYEETVNCVSPSSYMHVSDAEESHHDSDHDEAVAANEQHSVVEEEIEQQPPMKKNKLWDEREAM